jgi:DNA-directed RNA polymerase beta' subunit
VGRRIEQAAQDVLPHSYRKSLDFSVLSATSIMEISKAEITNAELYNGPLKPVENGPLDLRLGVGTKLLRCLTCGEGL